MSGSEKFKRLACLAFFVIVIVGCSANVGTPTEIFNKTDLEISESNPKVVGVKKHKNYEIVVYEYDESGEGKDGKKKDVDIDSNSPEITDNSVEIPIMDHPTSAPTKKSRGSTSSKPDLSHDSGSDEEPYETSSSEESSTSVEAPKLTSGDAKKTTSSSPASSQTTKKPVATTTKPRLPKPFRTTKSPRKDEDSDEGSYDDDDEYTEEDFSHDPRFSRSRFNDFLHNRGRSQVSRDRLVPPGRGQSEKRKPPSSLKYDEDDDYYDEYDYGRRGTSRPGMPGRRPQTTPRPNRKPGSGRITPKPFFPLIYDDSDEYEYDDDDNDKTTARTTTRKPAPKPKTARPKIDNAIKSKKKNTTAELDNEADDVWGIDKALKSEDPTGKPGICQEYARCSIFYQELLNDYDEPIEPADYKCRLPTQVGICCPLVSEEDVISEEPERKSSFKPISAGKRKQKRKVINPQIRRLIRTNLNNSFDYGDFFFRRAAWY